MAQIYYGRFYLEGSWYRLNFEKIKKVNYSESRGETIQFFIDTL